MFPMSRPYQLYKGNPHNSAYRQLLLMLQVTNDPFRLMISYYDLGELSMDATYKRNCLPLIIPSSSDSHETTGTEINNASTEYLIMLCPLFGMQKMFSVYFCGQQLEVCPKSRESNLCSCLKNRHYINSKCP